MKEIKLHLGCGSDYKKDYINCDISQEVKTDRIVDLEKDLPFKDDSVSEIYTRHTLEHIENFIPLMKEFHRVCINNSKIKIFVPYFSYIGSFGNPEHKRFFTFNTFNHFDIKNKKDKSSLGLFEIEKKKLKFLESQPLIGKPLSAFFNKFPNFYERIFAYLIPATEIEIELKVIK